MYFVCIEHKEKNVGRLFPIPVEHFLQIEDNYKKDMIDIKPVGINTAKVFFYSYDIPDYLINHEIISRNKLVASSIESNVKVSEINVWREKLMIKILSFSVIGRQMIVESFDVEFELQHLNEIKCTKILKYRT